MKNPKRKLATIISILREFIQSSTDYSNQMKQKKNDPRKFLTSGTIVYDYYKVNFFKAQQKILFKICDSINMRTHIIKIDTIPK